MTAQPTPELIERIALLMRDGFTRDEILQELLLEIDNPHHRPVIRTDLEEAIADVAPATRTPGRPSFSCELFRVRWKAASAAAGSQEIATVAPHFVGRSGEAIGADYLRQLVKRCGRPE